MRRTYPGSLTNMCSHFRSRARAEERRPALDAYLEQAKALSNHPQVMAAFASVEKNREGILREWRAITEVNAPSGKEKPRAALIEKLLRGYRLKNIYYDSAGNLIAVRKGTGGGPNGGLRRAHGHRVSGWLDD